MKEQMDLYEVIWIQGLQPELLSFCIGLNWLYIILLTTTFYGITHTKLLDSFIELSDKPWWRKNTMWIVGLIMIFTIFHLLEFQSLTWSYITSNLRSLFFTVIFSSIFVDIPVYIIKGFGKFIDTKAGGK